MTETDHHAALPEDIAEMAANANTLLEMISGYWITQILRAAADLSVMDHVAAGAATPEEVAERESSDPATTYRLMRACVSAGLLTHEGNRRFAVTKLGALLRAGAPGSLREMAMSQGARGHWHPWMFLPEAVRRGRSQAPAALGMPEGTSSFDYFAQNPEEGAIYTVAMSNATGMVVDDVVAAADLSRVGVAVDVGGADGVLVQSLMNRWPEVDGAVLDLPHVVEEAARRAEKAGVADRFTAVAGDFFAEVPAADLYLLKMILHDWNDEACRTILRNCRAAAKPGARALVIESVVGGLDQPGFAALLDMNMLATTPGQERDLDEFDALFAATGWRRIANTPTRTPQIILELEAI
jgi:hypothetical protein